MKVLHAPLLIAALALSALLHVPVVQADDGERIRQLQRSGQILPLANILGKAREIRPGRVLDVDLDKHDGRYIYDIEWLDPQGRVWDMEFDARTGQLLDLEQDD
ncbi:MAG TPA: PepSY domain-containing protein [Limnobacter sp.]|nr:PepSY domain-containing protein [Limnobacter sp.]